MAQSQKIGMQDECRYGSGFSSIYWNPPGYQLDNLLDYKDQEGQIH